MKWLDAGAAVFAGFRTAWAILRKENPTLGKTLAAREVSSGFDALARFAPEIRKAIDVRFSNKRDDAVLVEDLAGALKPFFPVAAKAEHVAGFIVTLCNLGFIRS